MSPPAASRAEENRALVVLLSVIFLNIAGFGLVIPLLPFFVQRQGGGAVLARAGFQLQRVGIDVAERLQAGQQQRPAVAAAEQRLLQGAGAAPGRQQHGDVGQRQRVGRTFGQRRGA